MEIAALVILLAGLGAITDFKYHKIIAWPISKLKLINWRKLRIPVLVLIVLMALLNPSPSDFETYLYSIHEHPNHNYGRKYNFIIFSIYTYQYHSGKLSDHPGYDEIKQYNISPMVEVEYLGIIKNFF